MSNHYDVGGISTIEYIKKKLTPEQYRGFLLGNIIKYSSRANHKGDFEKDAGKLNEYAMWLGEQAAMNATTEIEQTKADENFCSNCDRCEDILWLVKDDLNYDALSDSLQRRIERFLSDKTKIGGTYA